MSPSHSRISVESSNFGHPGLATPNNGQGVWGRFWSLGKGSGLTPKKVTFQHVTNNGNTPIIQCIFYLGVPTRYGDHCLWKFEPKSSKFRFLLVKWKVNKILTRNLEVILILYICFNIIIGVGQSCIFQGLVTKFPMTYFFGLY